MSLANLWNLAMRSAADEAQPAWGCTLSGVTGHALRGGQGACIPAVFCRSARVLSD